ncbi:flagellar hook-associated protein FlgK [Phenylobacterium sp.]|uniref:flagellar hook-associated protein FlgK n=1 Tax=Phenylobacterium sp. TaxID=1871053 RepID=UPI002730CAEA|nr:flagellar hook-associated protein FlgK [Phenylobacterium sp.]MDP2212919.1 flagellar hook-associated protein FlgK [Phenylobacterium sp.]
MSLTAVLKTANSGLVASQVGLRAVSDNIANVNTPGYVRKIVDQQQLVVGGQGMGVEVSGVKRVTDQYLQLATLSSASESGRWDAVAQYMDNAQSLFGDPSGDSFFFGRLDAIWSAFAATANDPSSSLLRSQSLSSIEDFLNEGARINSSIAELGRTVDTQISANIDRANDLLEQINKLNADISRARMVNADASGSENIQSQLVDELATLINVQVTSRPTGGLMIRSTEGVMLAGDGAAVLSYSRTDSTKGYITATTSAGSGVGKPITITGGALRGLLDLRDDKLPGISDQLGEFLSRAADSINAAHNAASTVPAQASLTGRNTGLDLPTAISGFTGASTVAIVDAAGQLTRRVDIDFTAGTMSVDGGPAAAFTPASFLADLNASLGATGSATFVNGALSISATAGGVAIDEGTSNKAGRAFSHFFGLNDIVRSGGFTNYDTGLSGADPHGFTPGDQIIIRLAQQDGKPIRDVTVSVPAGTSMNDLVAALNHNTTGVGLYGQYTLDDQGGLKFTGSDPFYATTSIVQDNTARGAGGPSISALFGLGTVERAGRANRLQVAAAYTADPMKVGLAKLDLSVAPGQPVLTPGDGRGALALATAGDVVSRFSAAGALGNVNMTVSRYASEFGGSIGRESAAADTRRSSAQAVKTEAVNRRQSVEGVNLDEELVRLTTYQQAFNASARMIQAAKELFDVLTNIV